MAELIEIPFGWISRYSGGPKEPCIKWGPELPKGIWAILAVVRPIEKHCGLLLLCTQQKINQRDCGSQLHCSRLAGVTLAFTP